MVADPVTAGRLETISAQATEKTVAQPVFQPRNPGRLESCTFKVVAPKPKGEKRDSSDTTLWPPNRRM